MWKLTDLSENSISLFLYKHSFEAFKHARAGQIVFSFPSVADELN